MSEKKRIFVHRQTPKLHIKYALSYIDINTVKYQLHGQ